MFRIPAGHPASLRCLRSAVPPVHPRFAPAGMECDAGGLGLSRFRSGYPCPDFRVETTGSPRFLGNPRVCALLFDPGGIGNARPSRRPDAAFRHLNGVGSRKQAIFGAQSHGPHTRCLRFAGWITPPPRKTRFRLPATLCRAGLVTRWTPQKVSALCFTWHPPSPSFAWRTSGSRGRFPAPGPHRSGRARLTHPAPRDTASLREAQGMRKARRGQRVPLLQEHETVPCNVRRLRAA